MSRERVCMEELGGRWSGKRIEGIGEYNSLQVKRAC